MSVLYRYKFDKHQPTRRVMIDPFARFWTSSIRMAALSYGLREAALYSNWANPFSNLAAEPCKADEVARCIGS